MKPKAISPSDLLTVYISFTAIAGGKRRPILVLRNVDEQLLFFGLTSQYEKKSDKIKLQYYPIVDWQASGLDRASYVDIQSQQVVAWSKLTNIRYVGQLSDRDLHQLRDFILTYNSRLVEFEAQQRMHASENKETPE